MQAAVDFVARCLSSSVLAALGGVQFKTLTREQYQELETKDPSTFYLVESGNKTILYLGNSTIGSGVTGGNTIRVLNGNIGFSANMEVSSND